MIKFLDRIAVVLREAESFIVPVKWVWKMMEKEDSAMDVTVEQLTDQLRKDKRFRIFDEQKVGVDDNGSPLISEKAMETLDFYRGPRVMLRDRIPTRKEVVSFLLKKADQTFETLKKAWEIRPQGDETMEDQLLEALAKAQKLQRELRTVLTKEEERNEKAISDST